MNDKLKKANVILLASIPIIVIIEFYLWLKVNIIVALAFFVVSGIIIIKIYDKLTDKNKK